MTRATAGPSIDGAASGAGDPAPGSQRLGQTPRLRETAIGPMRRVAVEDLADVTDAGIVQMLLERCQVGSGTLTVTVQRQVCAGKRAEQPRPDGALVIGAVALPS